MDLFSPADVNTIMRKITAVRQAKEAKSQIDNLDEELIKNDRDGNDRKENDQSVEEAVGVISAEEQKHIEENRGKKFIG